MDRATIPTTAAPGIQRSQWRVIILSSLGGALEFYDFVIYSMFAQYIGAAFFPASNQLNSLIYSFSVFAVGYFARPIGGIVFSHFGDKYGRRRVFIISILSMSIATIGMGLLPTQASIGTSAAVLMVLLRLIQGFSLGGELPGAITFVVETAPRTAGFSAGFIFFCVNSGVALASALSLVVHELYSEAQISDWGWRIGFLFGGFLGLVSFWLRLSLHETPEFQLLRKNAAKRPFIELFRSHPAQVLVGVSSMIATAGFNGLLFAMPAFLPTYMGYSRVEAIQAQNICLVILSFGLLTAAWLGDRIPRRWILGAGGVGLMALSIPFSIAADLYPTRIRFSGVAISFNLAFSIFSGVAPLMAALLVSLTGSPVGPAYYMCFCGFLTFVGSLFLHRYDGRILRDQADGTGGAAATSFPAQ